ncbi:transcriptional regulator, LacI family [Rubellimicrobium thermophilum DSM 16684]|uniref:Transcriptional regulator, LacI family n=1 Tax=Rubellimicrobium thermophilum DSM 16684 TaxID=1123069 RepID=S9QP47_9RHOB|nr:LacI family DNA-binding transcriptional regulator [Rubellimicrobium thermophilum]EPX83206.1 transcriptional regulator, LacI family [Rubellimicrobium thermophilum DSM 16684]
MKRPTLPDLARAAGVSLSTVNRVLHDPAAVRPVTRERVLAAAEAIGFYGLGTIRHGMQAAQPHYRLGILLLQNRRRFYRRLGEALTAEAARWREARIDLDLVFLEDLTPEHVAERLRELACRCESIALVSAQHPVIAQAIDDVGARDVPVTGLITPLTATAAVSFVGLDNWKVGRTAAWAFHHMLPRPGKIGILLGSHRYRNQELNEAGFRSYFREHDPRFVLLDPLSTYEEAAVAREHVETLLRTHPDLSGLFLSGGGITGALAALAAIPRREGFVVVGYELFDDTRAALLDGRLTMVLSHPVEAMARETLATLIRTRLAGPGAGAQSVTLNFDIHTAENI